MMRNMESFGEVEPLPPVGVAHSPMCMVMANYNPDCEEECWLAGEEDEDEGDKRNPGESREERKKRRKSKRRKITEHLAERQVRGKYR